MARSSDQHNNELYRPSEVCLILKINRETLRRWRNDGKIPHVVLPGGSVRYRKREIDAMLNIQS